MRVIPGSLWDWQIRVSDPVAGIRDPEEVLVVLKYLAGRTQAIEQLLIMADFLKEQINNVGLCCLCVCVLRYRGEI